MLNLQIGPLALPLNPLLMMAGWWLAAWIADRLSAAGPRHAQRMAARALMLAAGAGVLASRLAFVALAWHAYAEDPVSALNVRDGGWMPWAGLAAAAGVVVAFGWRYAATRRALAAASLAGFAAWAAVSAALGVHDRPPLPSTALQSLDGASVSLRSDGRPTVINLWASWCAPCRAEMPILARAQQRHRDVRFVFVNHGESAGLVRQWLARQPYELHEVALDPDRQLADALGTSGLPTTVFVDAKGRVVDRHFGPLSAASLGIALSRLQ